MTSYSVFYKSLENKLKKNKMIKFKNRFNQNIFFNFKKKNYEIIINTYSSNFLFKKYFSKQIKKDYNSFAFTTIIDHKKTKNIIAEQYFTQFGPLAFLPISNTRTSIVFSVFQKANYSQKNTNTGRGNKNFHAFEK